MTTRDERAALERFAGPYAGGHDEVYRVMERAVIGGDWALCLSDQFGA